MHGAAAELVLLADSGEAKKAGPLALAVVLVLFIACYFLFRSMSRHLRKVRTEFPVGASGAEPPAAGAQAVPERYAHRLGDRGLYPRRQVISASASRPAPEDS